MRKLKVGLLFLTILLSNSATLLPMAHIRNLGKSSFNFITKSFNSLSSPFKKPAGATINFIKHHKKLTSLLVDFGLGGYAYYAYTHRVGIAHHIDDAVRTCLTLPRTIKNFTAACLIRSHIPYLVMRGVNIRAQTAGIAPIFAAARYGIIEGLNHLITPENINWQNVQGATPLAEAAAHNQAAVQWLLDHGADPAIADDMGNDAIDRAELAGFHGIAELLIAHVQRIHPDMPYRIIHDINRQARLTNVAPIFYAAQHGIIEGLRHIVTRANVNVPNALGVTPLAEAAAHNQEATVQWLLAHGANPAIPDERGDRAIDKADTAGFNSIVNILAQHELRRLGIDAVTAPAAESTVAQADDADATGPTIECPLCFDEKHNFVTLACKHQYCRACLNKMLDLAILEKTSAQLICPNTACKNAKGNRTTLEMADLELFATKQKLDAIEAIKTQETFATLGIKNCPTPNCRNQFEVQGARPMLRRCELCTRRYCNHCLIQHTATITCEEARATRNMTAEERATAEWTRTHTKPCPGCRRNIEKNEGCNHMTCRKEAGGCGHEFCWICMQPWDGTCGSYNCMRQPQRNAPAQDLRGAARAAVEVGMFGHRDPGVDAFPAVYVERAADVAPAEAAPRRLWPRF